MWLLDEPTLGLDDPAIARLGDVLARHRAKGGMIVAATHVALPLPDVVALALNPPQMLFPGAVSSDKMVEGRS